MSLGCPNDRDAMYLLAGSILSVCAQVGRAAAVPSTALSAALHRDIDKDDLPFQPLSACRGSIPCTPYCPRDTCAMHRSGLAIVVTRYDGHRGAARPGAEIEITQQKHVGIDPDLVGLREHLKAEIVREMRHRRHAVNREIVQ